MARNLIVALLLAILIPSTAVAAPETGDESTYLQTMMALVKLATDSSHPLNGSAYQLSLTANYLRQVKAWWLQNVTPPDRYQYINDDFGNFLTNEIDAVSLMADAGTQVESAAAVGYWPSAQAKTNAQAEIDQSKLSMAASNDGFNAFAADLHAEIDGLTEWSQ